MARLLLSGTESLGDVATAYRRVIEASAQVQREHALTVLRVELTRHLKIIEQAHTLATEAAELVGTEEERGI